MLATIITDQDDEKDGSDDNNSESKVESQRPPMQPKAISAVIYPKMCNNKRRQSFHFAPRNISLFNVTNALHFGAAVKNTS